MRKLTTRTLPSLDPRDADMTYAHYLETCRRLNVEPVPRERADKLIAEWAAAIAAGRSVPPAPR